MTQAFNLSQLANNVDTNGDLNAAVGLYNQVPVANGGTGAATLTANAVLIGNGTSAVTTVAAGTAGNVLTSNGTTWTSAANPASSNVNTMILGTASGTWTKPATVKSIKVTVVGGGGNGGTGAGNFPAPGGNGGAGGGGGTAVRYYSAASLPGPQPYTVGGGAGTSSFGVAPVTVVSATGGVSGTAGGPITPGTPGAGGTGSNGQLNVAGSGFVSNATFIGGASLFSTLGDAQLYGGGGKGGFGYPLSIPVPGLGTTGASGFVMIEEFY
jgi:hypothetical protein